MNGIFSQDTFHTINKYFSIPEKWSFSQKLWSSILRGWFFVTLTDSTSHEIDLELERLLEVLSINFMFSIFNRFDSNKTCVFHVPFLLFLCLLLFWNREFSFLNFYSVHEKFWWRKNKKQPINTSNSARDLLPNVLFLSHYWFYWYFHRQFIVIHSFTL